MSYVLHDAVLGGVVGKAANQNEGSAAELDSGRTTKAQYYQEICASSWTARAREKPELIGLERRL
jgi:hypothetical protein